MKPRTEDNQERSTQADQQLQDTSEPFEWQDHKEEQEHKENEEPTSLPAIAIPKLDEAEKGEVQKRVSISAVVVHETVREEGERELKRSILGLACSALAAGLSMGFSMLAKGLLNAYLPAGASWAILIDSFGYSLGFLIVVLGRQQLFTENTLTAILPLLAHPNRHTLWRVLRLWVIVLFFNLFGALLFATFVVHVRVFPPEVRATFIHLAQMAITGNFGVMLAKGVFAGWLIALMVWLLPAAENTRLQTIIILTYFIGIGGFAHIIVDSVDAFYLINLGLLGWGYYLGSVLVPVLLGNIIGGVSLVDVLNYGQVVGNGDGDGNNSSEKTK